MFACLTSIKQQRSFAMMNSIVNMVNNHRIYDRSVFMKKFFRFIATLSLLVIPCMLACKGTSKTPPIKVKVEVIASEGGTVHVSPSLPTDGMVQEGTTLTFTADPNDDYDLQKWTMNENEVHGTELEWKLTVQKENIKVNAYFLNQNEFTVNIESSENGKVTASPEIPQNKKVRGNTVITFTATPNDGFVVKEWVIVGLDPLEGGEDGNTTAKVKITDNLSITATFKSNAPIAKSGETGPLHWEYIEESDEVKTLKITGTGAMPDYASLEEVPWIDLAEDITKVTIAAGCTNIGNYAFMNVIALKEATIPNTVTRIGKWAFQAALSLATINIPSSVKIIEESAFEDVQELKTLTLNEGLETIGEFAFSGCAKLEGLHLPSTLKDIGRSAFEGCEAISQITIPSQIKRILENTFTNCIALSSLTLNEGLEEISKEAFAGCATLQNPNIPASVNKIGEGAFSDCSEMTSITVATGNTDFLAESGVLYNISKTRLLTYPSKKADTSFNIPTTVTEIDGLAFTGVKALTSVSFPQNLEKLGTNAFNRCDNITTINLPASIKEIKVAPFHSCAALTSISIPSANTKYMTEDGILYNKDKTHLIQYPAGKENADYVAPNSLQKIGGYAFFQNVNLKTVDLPSTVNFIGIFAFGFSRSIEKITCRVEDPATIELEMLAFFRGAQAVECTLYVPKGSITKYQVAEQWASFAPNIKELP